MAREAPGSRGALVQMSQGGRPCAWKSLTGRQPITGHAARPSGSVSELSASSGQGFQRGVCARDLAPWLARSSHGMVPVHMFVSPASAFRRHIGREHGSDLF